MPKASGVLSGHIVIRDGVYGPPAGAGGAALAGAGRPANIANVRNAEATDIFMMQPSALNLRRDRQEAAA
jgi:hypothetical protein